MCHLPRGKSKLEKLPCEHFLHQIEISRSFLRAKQVGKKEREISIFCRNCSQGSDSYFDFPRPKIIRCFTKRSTSVSVKNEALFRHRVLKKMNSFQNGQNLKRKQVFFATLQLITKSVYVLKRFSFQRKSFQREKKQ